jgi:hypothetical protein
VSTATATRATRAAKRTASASTTRPEATTRRTSRRPPAKTTRAADQGTPPADEPAGQRRQPRAVAAADRAERRGNLRLRLPVIGDVGLPSLDEVAFLGGVVVLAGIGIVDWPVAVLIAVGHRLATNARFRSLRQFGEALEEG